MPYADLPALHLWYTDSRGSGAPVVALHAMSGTAESWVYQLPAFTAAGYRFIAYDRRNWGRTRDGSAAEAPRTGSEDLRGLLDFLGLDAVHLIGTAAGGGAALDFALTHPERLRSLVIADAVGGVQDPEYLAVQHRLRPPQIQALPIELRELSAGYRGTNPDGTQRWIEIERESRHEGGREAQRSSVRPALSLLETLRLPVLMIAGDADLLTPPALMRLLAAHIPECRFMTVPEAGHAAFWEQSEIWNRTVLEFLAQH
jgi:pimeloyl-ACP methyl ester carboxylesterase